MSSYDDYFQKQDTPEWAKAWKFTHFSPSQANNPDDTWIANYFIASRQERQTWAYNPNVIFGNAIHQGIGLVAKKNIINIRSINRNSKTINDLYAQR